MRTVQHEKLADPQFKVIDVLNYSKYFILFHIVCMIDGIKEGCSVVVS